MTRRVFFSFHYERDAWRAANVRSSWVTKPSREEAGYIDAASWEAVKRQGDNAIKRWINDQLNGTSVTVVLIGAQTDGRPWVDYEIEQSYMKGNGLLGIRIHNIRDSRGYTDTEGTNPFDRWHVTDEGRTTYFSEMYHTYDWVYHDGRSNMGAWVEQAARDAGR